MNSSSFALFGEKPAFDTLIPVGQFYFPSWERYASAFQGIFDRQYYTNQGALANELEEKLQEYLGVKNAICITNATIGLMMVAEAMELSGKVIVPAFTFIASAQSLSWAGIEPVFCDIKMDTQQIDPGKISSLIDADVSAIMGVNLWGGSCNPKELESLANACGVKLFFDSAHAFGCKVNNKSIGNFGQAEVFSFHATKVLSATEGGCICTNDDDLAARIRNIRSSYGAGRPVSVVKTSNGRMSEAQAAIALLSLEDFSANQKNNERLYKLYKNMIDDIEGLTLIEPVDVSFSNYQYLICMVDEELFGLSRDVLLALLKAENILARRYFFPGLHRSIPYVDDLPQYVDLLPNTDDVCANVIQLPMGAFVTDADVELICSIINRAQNSAREISARYED